MATARPIRRAASLVELIVVVAVIALAMAIILSVFIRVYKVIEALRG